MIKKISLQKIVFAKQKDYIVLIKSGVSRLKEIR